MNIVKFDPETHTGIVTDYGFYNELPTNMHEDMFTWVDNYRELKMKEVIDETLDYAAEILFSDTIVINDIPMGAKATAKVSLSPDLVLSAETNYVHTALFSDIMEKAQSLFVANHAAVNAIA